MRKPLSLETLQRRVDAAMGKIPCDTIIQNAWWLDVFRAEFVQSDIAIIDGVIVATEEGLRGRQVFDASNHWLVPGFIDAHVHVESSMMLPRSFEASVLSRGTTTAICDPHELANVQGVRGIEYFLNEAEQLRMDLWVMLSSCVPATHLETNGGGEIQAAELIKLRSHPRALGLAEMMNTPGVIHADPLVLEKIRAFSNGVIDGHAPLLRGKELSAYAACGISSCHESSGLEEAREKLQKGISVWIREGSVAKDLDALCPLLTMETSTSMGFCTDDRNPLDISTEGHIDYLIRRAIAGGVRAEVAYRAASLSVARHYGLKTGAIAPGFPADLVLLGDLATCAVEGVWKNGTPITELLASESPASGRGGFENSIRTHRVEPSDLEGPKGRVHVIGVREGKIITDHLIMDSEDPQVLKLSVLERYGKGGKPSHGYVTGFGNMRGAIASSVGHDSHNLIVVGRDPQDMARALECLRAEGGGFCVVQKGEVIASLALPFAGLMSRSTPQNLSQSLGELKVAAHSIGCSLSEPFLMLAFLSLPVIPKLKLTDKGLVDVERFALISVST